MPVLIINNDSFFLHILRQAFERQGHYVIVSKNSSIAVQLFLQHKPRAVILDVFMENKDGFELLKELRNICKKTPIVAVSKDDRYLPAIQKLGATIALPKSLEPRHIVTMVNLHPITCKAFA